MAKEQSERDLEWVNGQIETLRAEIEARQRQAERIPSVRNQTAQNVLQDFLLVLDQFRVTDKQVLDSTDESSTQLNEILESERQRYWDLFEFAPDAYLVTNADGIIQEANRTASELLNLSPEQIVGRSLAVFLTPEGRPAFTEKLIWLQTATAIQNWEVRLQPYERSPVDIDLTVTRVPNCRDSADEGMQPCLHWLLRDVTQRKQFEAAVRERFFQVSFEQAAVGIAHVGPDAHFLRVNQRLCDTLGYTRDELLSLTFLDITHPDDIRLSLDLHHQLLNDVRDSQTFEKRYIHRNGSIIWVHITLSVVHDADGIPQYNISVVEDITERKRIEAAEAKQRILAEALRDAAISLTSTLDLSEVLDRILMNVGLVVPHDTAIIMFIEDDIAHIVRSRGYNGSELRDTLPTLRFLISSIPALREIVLTGKPVLIPDNRVDKLQLPGGESLRSVVIVPVQLYDKIIGFLNLNSTAPGFFTEEHAEHLQAFAAQAAIAIQNARLYEQAQQLAALEERQRLARELHDAVSQSLFSASLIAEALPRLWQRDSSKALNHLEQLKTLNRGALAEMRTLLMELRPDQLSNLDLGKQLYQMAQAVEGRRHVEVTLDVRDDWPAPPNVQLALYRIAQETFNNIIKHTRATLVHVRYSCLREKVELEISDNGKGFDPGKTLHGRGLETMHEHADLIHASLGIASASNKGTQITVIWLR